MSISASSRFCSMHRMWRPLSSSRKTISRASDSGSAHHHLRPSSGGFAGFLRLYATTNAMFAKPTALTDQERKHALETKLMAASTSLSPWKEDPSGRNAICKQYTFQDFSQAWAFMSRSALLAEKMDHHPEWFNVYNTVQVTLTTHDCQGVSDKDIAMAQAMDQYSASLLQSGV